MDNVGVNFVRMTPQEIKSSVDIVDVMSKYITLKRAGQGWKGLCPFHQEKTPSLSVSRERQSFYCFGGCGAKGDVFDFLQQYLDISFVEACRQLNEDAVIEIPTQENHPCLNQDQTKWLQSAIDVADIWQRVYLSQIEKNICRDIADNASRDKWKLLNVNQRQIITAGLEDQLKKLNSLNNGIVPSSTIISRVINGTVEPFITGSESFREQCIALIKNQ